MPGLNSRQREAVRYTAAPLLVLAGAGSGKTRVITRKIAYLIEDKGLQPRHICAVTFTNKAAREMRERVSQQLKGVNTRGLRISTFHTLGLDILRKAPEQVGLRSGFSLLDAQDSESLIKEHLRGTAEVDAISASAVQHRISRWKNDLIDPAAALSRAEDDFEARLAALYADYERSLRAYNAVDFDDLILAPARLFQSRPAVLEAWQDRLRYLLVDEYQDTNSAQYELVRLLTGTRGAFTVVGDDDQSIYAWRGARPENLARLQEDYPELKVIMLEQNYRSSARILGLANTLIAKNPHVFEKRLWSEHGPGDMPRVLRCTDEANEAERVASEILHLHFAEKVPFGDVAVLFRGNHQARPFEKALREHNIPYFLSGGTSFFARAEVKDAMAYLRLLANPEDDAAFLRIVNTPRREIGPTTLERLADYTREQGTSLLAGCEDPGLAEHLSERQRNRLGAFVDLIREHRRRSAEDPVGGVRALIETIDYYAWLREHASSQRVAERRYENVGDLLEWLGKLQKGDFHDKGLADMVGHLTLMDVLDRQEEEAGGDRVHLMTLHACKGLEFPHVFLVGMEEELLPHRSSIEEDTIEEERRLAYVGITRAQRALTFTLTSRRRRYGEWIRSEPSRFLTELPADQLDWGGERSDTPENRKARGMSHLHMLKGILDAG
ncbi:UvrD-helicase domain-containing protein [Thiorhodococcus mannitoliphagus]|uniref:ATP-dependent DNA helicase Rep n=1 Tax=Thiorhodococcus mannitoliphagus TaxID=329406 RepID=A0A6P1DWA9_9GAMM|nr:UvrD-helicase domain-containing protein [Thiorhodococcus mannitoliphagus]NEX20996.1 UvrD-helicase domain-containing protein [Thiorhodococcus mannitoliphagus]